MQKRTFSKIVVYLLLFQKFKKIHFFLSCFKFNLANKKTQNFSVANCSIFSTILY